MSEIIDLKDIKLSRMSPDELIVESIESTAENFIQVNKTLKDIMQRMHILELSVSDLSQTVLFDEEEI
jgi:hypothetical protein